MLYSRTFRAQLANSAFPEIRVPRWNALESATLSINQSILDKLEQRLGRLHAKQRLGIERDHEAQIFGQGLNFFHIENWYSIHSIIRGVLKLGGLYQRGLRNASRIQIRHNSVHSQKLSPAFDGYTLLHLSDLHIDMNDGAMRCLEELVPNLEYDLCVMTGDYRGPTLGLSTPPLRV